MEEASAQTVATFTGTLLRRKRMPGTSFVQLIFREAERDWLCLSSNLQHVASLEVGKKYQIEGIFKAIGEHEYIHEPDITPIAHEIKKRRVWISVGLGIGIVFAAGGIVLAATHDPSAPKPDSSMNNTTASQQTPITDANSGASTDTAASTPSTGTTSTPPATTTTTPKPKTTTTSKVTVPVVVTPPVTPPASTPVVTPPTPYCDSPVDIPFTNTDQPDPSQPVGYSNIITHGVVGQQKTCYPDGTPASATTTVITPPVNQVTDVGTGPADPNPNPNPGP